MLKFNKSFKINDLFFIRTIIVKYIIKKKITYMNFYIVFTKNKNKFDKYVKVNKIKNKVIIDIKTLLLDYDIDNYDKYKDYFNLIIYTKILHTLEKNKDIYYIPNFIDGEEFDVDELLNFKDILPDTEFNLLFFFDEFKDNDKLCHSILNRMDMFDASQILKSY